jgi:hypothetical protein
MLQSDRAGGDGQCELPRALGYIRVSTDRQERSPASLGMAGPDTASSACGPWKERRLEPAGSATSGSGGSWRRSTAFMPRRG